MMNRKMARSVLRYRKRPEPHRVVPLASLNRTESKSEMVNMTSIVDNSGNIADNERGSPLGKNSPNRDQPSSWAGLHSRMMATMPLKAEVS